MLRVAKWDYSHTQTVYFLQKRVKVKRRAMARKRIIEEELITFLNNAMKYSKV